MKNKCVDPSVQFLLLLSCGILILIANVQQLLLLNAFTIFYLLYNGFWKTAVKAGALVALVSILHSYFSIVGGEILTIIGFFTFLLLRFSPVIMVSRVLQEVPSGKLMVSLQKVGIPKNIVITVAVTLRFFSIIKVENDAIQTSAKLRGLALSQPKNWLHPLNSFEYTFVPLMMRTLKISDELAAAAMTKGIDFPSARTSIYSSRLTTKDGLLVLVFALYVVWLFFFS